ncbi:aquaporin [Yasminevirus sp. GU-2018]|uniref:Aquaporin n=1 Tax=Yasminevirus sp. GU-2018 TaxID=2420051 RepID=A0A5K0U881_9VIRU|nr:aquaporin [Yasminevirus sp. GU-2018]
MQLINYLVEFLGTFVFLYIILESAGYGNSQPFVIAIGLLSAILLFGSVSGGHFNPAVTTMVWAKGDSNVEPIGYVLAQVAGGLAAYKVHQYITVTKNA